jgi:cyanophycin synthetase
MSHFETGPDATPGRLNVFDALPFRVILDYAHNADGFRKLSAFIDTQTVSGRKILVFGIDSKHRDVDIKAELSELAGHYDLYVCVNSRDLRRRQANEIPNLLASGLISAGVAKSDIRLIFEFDGWWRKGLALAAAGDLLVLIPDTEEVRPIWETLGGMAAAVKHPR